MCYLAFCLLVLVQGVDGHADGKRQKTCAHEQGGRAPRPQFASEKDGNAFEWMNPEYLWYDWGGQRVRVEEKLN